MDTADTAMRASKVWLQALVRGASGSLGASRRRLEYGLLPAAAAQIPYATPRCLCSSQRLVTNSYSTDGGGARRARFDTARGHVSTEGSGEEPTGESSHPTGRAMMPASNALNFLYDKYY